MQGGETPPHVPHKSVTVARPHCTTLDPPSETEAVSRELVADVHV